MLAAYRKLKTENEGYRERITRNLEQRFDQRRERLLLRFIEILDNLDRALEAAELTYAGNPLIEGLILVRTQLLQTLKEEGLERIPVVGLPYDPAVSEAVETSPVDDPEQHHVVLRDLQRGYRLQGRVARASKVVVGEYAGAAAEPAAPAEAPPAEESPAEPETPAAAHEEELTLSSLGLDARASAETDESPAPAEADARQDDFEDPTVSADDLEALFPAAFEPDSKKPDDE